MPDTKSALLVMTEDELSQELTTLLGGMGYLVTGFANVSNVREHLDDNRYDLLIMGATLPNLSWRATVNDLRGDNAARIIMITRTARDADMRSALSGGGYAVLDRPISSTKLSGIIALRRYGMFVVARDKSR